MGGKGGIPQDIPDEYHWRDINWNIFGCRSILVLKYSHGRWATLSLAESIRCCHFYSIIRRGCNITCPGRSLLRAFYDSFASCTKDKWAIWPNLKLLCQRMQSKTPPLARVLRRLLRTTDHLGTCHLPAEPPTKIRLKCGSTAKSDFHSRDQ